MDVVAVLCYDSVSSPEVSRCIELNGMEWNCLKFLFDVNCGYNQLRAWLRKNEFMNEKQGILEEDFQNIRLCRVGLAFRYYYYYFPKKKRVEVRCFLGVKTEFTQIIKTNGKQE